MKMLRYLKYLLLISMLIIGWLITADISFADDISPTDTKNIPPAVYPGPALWCEKLGFYVYLYRYELTFITIGLCLAFLCVTEYVIPAATNPISPHDVELIQKVLAELPEDSTFQKAAFRYPELLKEPNFKSELLPEVIRIKLAVSDQSIPVTQWSLPVGVLDNAGNVYRVYALNSNEPHVITSFTEAFNAQYPIEILRLASKLGPYEGFAISPTIVVDPFTNANNAYYLIDLVKGTPTPGHTFITDGSLGSLDNSTRIVGRMFFKYHPIISTNNLLTAT